MEKLPERLKKARGSLSARKFAEIFGVNQQTIYRYEWGERKPDLPFLKAVADKTGVPLDWLKGEDYTENIKPDILVQPNIARSKATQCSSCEDLKNRLLKSEARVEHLEKEQQKFIEDIRILHDKVELLLRENGDLKAEVATLRMKPTGDEGGGR